MRAGAGPGMGAGMAVVWGLQGRIGRERAAVVEVEVFATDRHLGRRSGVA